MGKKGKKGGKASDDKQKAKERKRQQQAQKATRKSKKQDKSAESDDEDIDKILAELEEAELAKTAVTVTECERPSPRVNATLTAHPSNENELIVFGGEFFNGERQFVYSDLYRFDVAKQTWLAVSSPNTPLARCSHQAVGVHMYGKDYVFVFGGEFATVNKFFHHGDLWRLDLETNEWLRVEAGKGPKARSGARMALFQKRYLVLFGGFHDVGAKPVYFEDLWLFDLDEAKWIALEPPKTAVIGPGPRSAVQMFVHADMVYVYGGYSKIKGKDDYVGKTHDDMYRGKISVGDKRVVWEKIKRAGMPPPARSGVSTFYYRNVAYFFGGVWDDDELETTTFFNELYIFQADRHRWYPLQLRLKNKGKKKRRRAFKGKRKTQEEEGDNAREGGDDDDGDEDEDDDGEGGERKKKRFDEYQWGDDYDDYEWEFEDEDDDEEGEDDGEKEGGEERGEGDKEDNKGGANDKDDEDKEGGDGNKQEQEGQQQEGQQPKEEQPILPAPRMNAMVAVQGNTLYLFGGMLEVRSREITFDDLYSLNLSKLDTFKAILEARIDTQEWLGEDEDEDDDDDDEDEEDDEDEDGEEEGDEEGDEEGGGNEDDGAEEQAADEGKAQASTSAFAVGSVAAGGYQELTLEKRATSRRKKREELNNKLREESESSTPQPGEPLRAFYERTAQFWKTKAFEEQTAEERKAEDEAETRRVKGSAGSTEKTLRRDGFHLAEARWHDMQPLLQELELIEKEEAAERKAAKAKGKGRLAAGGGKRR